MNWQNVRLILHREVRDQLRDRRTLFMIFVLPVLMYPLLGMSMFQVAQFMRDEPTPVAVFGADALPESPPLIEEGKFAARWFADIEKADLLKVELVSEVATHDEAQRLVSDGKYKAVVIVPADFAAQLQAFQERLKRRAQDQVAESNSESQVPSPEIIYNGAKEESQLAYLRVSRVLTHWTDEIVRQNLQESRVPVAAVKPFAVSEFDMAESDQRSAAIWSKILPFLLLVWALTGAFYPAIDICAGEKERGTLETLLSSPAQRSEIVWGKLLTVMLFSLATAALNIASIGLTGAAVSSHLPDLAPPPPMAAVWLTLALLPMSAMFSALCLSLAAFARSTKEGQYYLMPLVMVALPLVVLPMSPGVELTLGNSLIPVTGVMLLMRSMLEGEYLRALPYIPTVLAMTAACCLLAIRWAIEQFNSEGVLFRESERFDLASWVRHLARDRGDTPSFAAAVACAVLILMLRFFFSLAEQPPETFDVLARSAVAGLIGVVLTPALLMTLFMARSPVKALLLRRPTWLALPAAALLAVALHPLVMSLSHVVRALYPIDAKLLEPIERLMQQAPNVWILIACFALAPAFCEELTYRGFILSGLRHSNRWRAIVISSVLFGITHGFLQQSIMATITGLALGYIAIQTGSIFPGMIYHACHNSIPLLIAQLTPEMFAERPWLAWLGQVKPEGGLEFHWSVTAAGALIAGGIFYWLSRLPAEKGIAATVEESQDFQTAHIIAASLAARGGNEPAG